MGNIHSQKMLKVSENRELPDFVQTEPNSMNGMSQFLKSQGVELDELDYGEYLNVFTKMFQEQFPGEYATTLEPHMRERLATLAGEMSTSLESGFSQEEFFEDVMVKFLIEEQNIPWMMTYFEGDFLKQHVGQEISFKIRYHRPLKHLILPLPMAYPHFRNKTTLTLHQIASWNLKRIQARFQIQYPLLSKVLNLERKTILMLIQQSHRHHLNSPLKNTLKTRFVNNSHPKDLTAPWRL